MGSIRLKVLEKLTAGLTGWLYLREQLRPCRLRLAGFGGCRTLHAFAQFSATKGSIPHHSATHALGPLLSPRPTRFTTVRFGFRPFPRGQVRNLVRGDDASRPQRASRLPCIPLLPCVSKPVLPPTRTCFISLCELASRGLTSASNDCEAQPAAGAESLCDPPVARQH